MNLKSISNKIKRLRKWIPIIWNDDKDFYQILKLQLEDFDQTKETKECIKILSRLINDNYLESEFEDHYKRYPRYEQHIWEPWMDDPKMINEYSKLKRLKDKYRYNDRNRLFNLIKHHCKE